MYKGTFERGSDELLRIHTGDTTHQYSDYCRKSREGFQTEPGLSRNPAGDRQEQARLFRLLLGRVLRNDHPAVEDRLKVSVLKNAGFWDFSRPEVNEFNYVTRVRIPTLMLNGKYDPVFPLETAVRPMLRPPGNSTKDKKLSLYETDHSIPQNEFIRGDT